MVISLARVIFDSSRWTRCEMGSDWLSHGQPGFAAWPPAAAPPGCAAPASAGAANDSGTNSAKDAVMVTSGGSRRARRPPGRRLITGISFIEPSGCCDDSRGDPREGGNARAARLWPGLRRPVIHRCGHEAIDLPLPAVSGAASTGDVTPTRI